MIIRKEIYFDGRPFILQYSDKKVLIKDAITENLFSSAMDELNNVHEYVETESVIDSGDLDGFFTELENM